MSVHKYLQFSPYRVMEGASGAGFAQAEIQAKFMKSRVLEPVGEILERNVTRGECSPVADDCPFTG